MREASSVSVYSESEMDLATASQNYHEDDVDDEESQVFETTGTYTETNDHSEWASTTATKTEDFTTSYYSDEDTEETTGSRVRVATTL